MALLGRLIKEGKIKNSWLDDISDPDLGFMTRGGVYVTRQGAERIAGLDKGPGVAFPGVEGESVSLSEKGKMPKPINLKEKLEAGRAAKKPAEEIHPRTLPKAETAKPAGTPFEQIAMAFDVPGTNTNVQVSGGKPPTLAMKDDPWVHQIGYSGALDLSDPQNYSALVEKVRKEGLVPPPNDQHVYSYPLSIMNDKIRRPTATYAFIKGAPTEQLKTMSGWTEGRFTGNVPPENITLVQPKPGETLRDAYTRTLAEQGEKVKKNIKIEVKGKKGK
jgi:hypothetical protein